MTEARAAGSAKADPALGDIQFLRVLNHITPISGWSLGFRLDCSCFSVVGLLIDQSHR